MILSKSTQAWLNRQPPIPNIFVCDGCTWCADNWFGVSLFPACKVHDWHYSRGRRGRASTKNDRLMADKVFRYNIFIRMRTKFGSLYSWYFAQRRYLAVRWFAGAAFEGERK